MADLIVALVQLPTLVFTGMLGACLLYWLLIIVGVADLNPLEGAEGALKGGAEGALKAVGESLAFLGLTRIPVTISVSVFSLLAWFLSIATRQALDPVLPGWASALAATAVSVGGGLFVTSLVTRGMAGLFEEKPRPGGESLVGRTVKVTTEHVDRERGQGEVDDGAGGITLTIRCASTALTRGAEAVVIEVDRAAGIYWVEPTSALYGVTPSAPAASAEPVSHVPGDTSAAGDRNQS